MLRAIYSFFVSDRLTWQNLGLISFVFTTLSIIAIIVFDFYLFRSGRTMITEFCRANPWCAWLILVVLQIGMIGLAVHFMAPVAVVSEDSGK